MTEVEIAKWGKKNRLQGAYTEMPKGSHGMLLSTTHKGQDKHGNHHYETRSFTPTPHLGDGAFKHAGTAKWRASSDGKVFQGKNEISAEGPVNNHMRGAHKAFHAPAKKKVSKAMGEKKAYCKAHKSFDDCSTKVAKMDDGIHHLLETGRINRSQEDRGTGGLVALETGKRGLDGTPMMGHAEGAAQISEDEKMGASGKAKPVGQTKIKEQVGKSAPSPHDAFLMEDIEKFGHTSAELMALGEKEQKRWNGDAGGSKWKKHFWNPKYGKEFNKEIKGGRLAAVGAGMADSIRHPLMTSVLAHPVKSAHRIRGSQREAALKSKAKKGVSKSHDAFLGDAD